MMLLILFSMNSYSQIKKTSINEAVGYKSFIATAYCLSKNKTAIGIIPRNGIIAADPRVLKLGTKVNILNMGNYLVADTGSAIKNNKIDIWVSSCSKAKVFGRKKVYIKIM